MDLLPGLGPGKIVILSQNVSDVSPVNNSELILAIMVDTGLKFYTVPS